MKNGLEYENTHENRSAERQNVQIPPLWLLNINRHNVTGPLPDELHNIMLLSDIV